MRIPKLSPGGTTVGVGLGKYAGDDGTQTLGTWDVRSLYRNMDNMCTVNRVAYTTDWSFLDAVLSRVSVPADQ